MEDEGPDMDPAALERAVGALAAQEGAFDSDDPRQAARAMREFYRAGGMEMGPGAEEYLRRLEAGQDPEEVDRELGDLLDQEDPFAPRTGPGKKPRTGPPAKDEKLYPL